MLNESIDVWRQICDSLELDNSLTTALRKFVTFGQSLFIVCPRNLLGKALNCCWVCVYDMGRRQPWESAPRKLDPSVQNLISRYLLSPSTHIYPPKPAKKEIVFFYHYIADDALLYITVLAQIGLEKKLWTNGFILPPIDYVVPWCHFKPV